MKFRTIGAAAIAASLLASPVMAADIAPLAPGKPAGTKDAALLAASPFLLIGALALVVVVAVAASGGDDKGTTTPTTGTGA